jgi:subtilisin family serine protease
MATPHVSGVVGLIIAAYGDKAKAKMRELLIKTSVKRDSLDNISVSDGMVDAAAALSAMSSRRR